MITVAEMPERNFDILKIEIQIISSRIMQIEDSLWKMRRISLTIWLATIGLGLGVISQNAKPIQELISLSIFLPIMFALLDANYYIRFRQFVLREREISKFLNFSDYSLPNNYILAKSSHEINSDKLLFPILDIKGKLTFGDNQDYKWQSSYRRNLSRKTPFTLYSMQMIGSIFFGIKMISNYFLYIPLFIGFLFIILILFYRLISNGRCEKTNPKNH